MRFISYKSKNTIEDITNPRLIGSHVKEIVEDTMKDELMNFLPTNILILIIEKFPVTLKEGIPNVQEIYRTDRKR